MQSIHFHFVVVNDLYNYHFVEIGIMHLWAYVQKNSLIV